MIQLSPYLLRHHLQQLEHSFQCDVFDGSLFLTSIRSHGSITGKWMIRNCGSILRARVGLAQRLDLGVLGLRVTARSKGAGSPGKTARSHCRELQAIGSIISDADRQILRLACDSARVRVNGSILISPVGLHGRLACAQRGLLYVGSIRWWSESFSAAR